VEYTNLQAGGGKIARRREEEMKKDLMQLVGARSGLLLTLLSSFFGLILAKGIG
jgi:hypothetical protein